MPFPRRGVWMYFICIIEIVWLENVCLLVLQSFILPMGSSGLCALAYFLCACHATIASELREKKKKQPSESGEYDDLGPSGDGLMGKFI